MNTEIIPEKFFARGSSYVRNTIAIWGLRRDKLISLWSKIFITENTDEQLKRISGFIEITESRIGILYRFEDERNEQIIKDKIEADEMIVMLECPSFDCRYGLDAYGRGIKYKDYEPGKLKCDKCGLTLREQNQRNVDEMLLKAGIKF